MTQKEGCFSYKLDNSQTCLLYGQDTEHLSFFFHEFLTDNSYNGVVYLG